MAILSPVEWDQYLTRHPEAHILQSTNWGELKASFGWNVLRVQQGDAGAQILIRRLLPGINLGYIPKGPIGANWPDLLPEIDRECRKQHCVFLKLEPDIWVSSSPQPEAKDDPPTGFRSSPQSIQPANTLVINLQADDQVLLARMKQKTRYNINLAVKKGVIIRPSTDLDIFHSLMDDTAQRDQFGVHSEKYYQAAYQLFHPNSQCELFLAEYQQTPLAALMVFTYQRRAWYFYGGSSNEQRERMPNYLLQWEAMRWARAQGCHEYDLWGVPDTHLENLEAQFTNRSDGLWGVYRFKRGFGGELRRSAGPWDRVYQPIIYQFYLTWLKSRHAV